MGFEAVTYDDVRELIRSGDLVVFNRDGLISMMGRRGGSHAATAVWRHADQNSLGLAETREGVGGRVVSLKHQVKLYPGCIDVYTPTDECPDELRERAATIAYNWSGRSYGYKRFGAMSVVESPLAFSIARWFGYDPDFEDLIPSPWDELKVCSQQHAWAYRWAKLELAGLLKVLDAKRIDQLDVSELLRWRACLAQGWDPCRGLGDRWVTPADLSRSFAYRPLAKGLVIA